MTAPAFPGGTSVSRLSVYRDAASDGLVGGTPHLHTASTEAYVVVSGHGALHTIDRSGFRETALAPGSTVWFTPGTIHRAINRGGLEVIVVMQNAGLPEAGDAVMTFPLEVIGDPARYREAATLPAGAAGEAMAVAVRQRRDLAVAGFHQIADAIQRGDTGPLNRLHDHAARLVQSRVAQWREIWEGTVAREAQLTADVLDALARGDAAHLRQATVLESPPSATARGACAGCSTPTMSPTRGRWERADLDHFADMASPRVALDLLCSLPFVTARAGRYEYHQRSAVSSTR